MGEISSIWLSRLGAENDPLARVVVDIELPDGTWRRAITELWDGQFSHCVNLNHELPRISVPGSYEDSPQHPSVTVEPADPGPTPKGGK